MDELERSDRLFIGYLLDDVENIVDKLESTLKDLLFLKRTVHCDIQKEFDIVDNLLVHTINSKIDNYLLECEYGIGRMVI